MGDGGSPCSRIVPQPVDAEEASLRWGDARQLQRLACDGSNPLSAQRGRDDERGGVGPGSGAGGPTKRAYGEPEPKAQSNFTDAVEPDHEDLPSLPARDSQPQRQMARSSSTIIDSGDKHPATRVSWCGCCRNVWGRARWYWRTSSDLLGAGRSRHEAIAKASPGRPGPATLRSHRMGRHNWRVPRESPVPLASRRRRTGGSTRRSRIPTIHLRRIGACAASGTNWLASQADGDPRAEAYLACQRTCSGARSAHRRKTRDSFRSAFRAGRAGQMSLHSGKIPRRPRANRPAAARS